MGSKIFGLPLKCAATVIGWLFLIIAVVLIVILSLVLMALLEFKEVDIGDEKSFSWFALTCLQIHFGMNIIMVCASVFLNILLLFGIFKKKSRFLLPFIGFKLLTTLSISFGMISYSHTLRSTILLILYSDTGGMHFTSKIIFASLTSAFRLTKLLFRSEMHSSSISNIITVFTFLAILHIHYRELKKESNEEMSITLDTLGSRSRSVN